MKTNGIIVIIIIALLIVLGIILGTGMVGDNNNHQNVSDMLLDNLESNNTVKMNDNGTSAVIDNNTHKIIHTSTKNSASGNDTASDNFISKEEAINIVKPGMIKEVKDWHPEFVSRMTFSATGPEIMRFGEREIAQYEVETSIDGNHYVTTWIDARTGEVLESIGIGDCSIGIREDGTWGPFTEEEYYKNNNITINDTDSFKEEESIENGS